MRIHELIIYKNLEQEQILNDMTFLMENYDNEYYNQEDLKSLLFECTGCILELGVDHGFEGNLWHDYLTFLLANDENAYSPPVRSWVSQAGASTRWHSTTLRYSRSCLTTTSQPWRQALAWTASP